MPAETQLLYLEPDDEITTVVRRLRESDAPRVVMVASGRAKATTSAVALRLLAQLAAEEGREVALVADAGGRALAAEAGIPAFASVAEASAEGAVPLPAAPAQRAPIHVVRGEPAPEPAAEATPPMAPVSATGLEETQAVLLPPRPSPTPVARLRPPTRGSPPQALQRVLPLVAVVAVLLLLVATGAAVAIVLPAATITVQPAPIDIGPLSYPVRPEVQPSDGEPLEATAGGEATGTRTRRVAAAGVVTFINYSDNDVLVPSGTHVSAGGSVVFETTQAVSVPDSSFFGGPGRADAEVVALEPGSAGNVAAEAIDQIEDADIDRALRERAGARDRRVINREATTGGAERELSFVRRKDVQRVIVALAADLEQQLQDLRAGTPERIYPVAELPPPEVSVPDDLVGQVTDGPYSFELTGALPNDQPYVLRADAEAAAEEALLADETATPEGTLLADDTIGVELGEATLDGEAIVVAASVTATAVPDVNTDALRRELAGRTAAEAEAALASIGPTDVELWPVWVDRIPGVEWRIRIDVLPAEPGA
jgi:hypothetical protein